MIKMDSHYPIFNKLLEVISAMVKRNTICWENEADFAPEFLSALAQEQVKDASVTIQKAA